MRKSKSIKLYSLLLATVFSLSFVTPCLCASGNTKAESVAMSCDAVQDKSVIDIGLDEYCTIRVSLTTPDNLLSSSFSLLGKYHIEETGKALCDTTLSIGIKNGTVSLYSSDNELLCSGTSIKIIRDDLAESAGYMTFNDRKYLGSFVLDTNVSGYLRIINYVPLAHYLYGVLGGEVGNSYPIEAMKAQSVAAKNYVLTKLRPSSAYDIGDTSSEQVYRGYNPAWTSIIKAVNACIDFSLTYNGKLFTTFYAASNGGETCLPSHAWGSSSLDGVYSLTLDRFDFENPDSRMETLKIPLGDADGIDEKLSVLLCTLAESELDEKVTSLDSVDSVAFSSPAYEGSVRNMERVTFEITVTADDEEESLSVEFDVALFRSCGVFNDSRLRTYWGEKKSGSYYIYHVRFGHGVGLSQCGAEQRARDGIEYGEILAFYYPTARPAVLRVAVPGIGNSPTPTPTATPTPTPTATPTATPDFTIPKVPGRMTQSDLPELTASPESDKGSDNRLSTAGEINDKLNAPNHFTTDVIAFAQLTDDGVNLRSRATTSSDIITKMPKGAEVSILNMYNAGWYKVIYGKYLGYVSSSYLNNVEYNVTQDIVHKSYQTGYTNAADVNFRESASTASLAIGKLEQNTPVYVWDTVASQGMDWYHVQIGLTYGYVAAQYINITGTYGTVPMYEGQVIASGVTNDSVNMRTGPSTTYEIITKLTANTQLLVFELVNNWYHVIVNGAVGYVRSDYVNLQSTLPVPPPESGSDTPSIPNATLLPVGIGTINADGVNFRILPSINSDVIATLEVGTQIVLYSLQDGWYEAISGGLHGYVYSPYVDATMYTDAPTPSDGLTLAKGITTANVNFRTLPTTSSEVHYQLDKGDTFDIIGETNNWFFVHINGITGYLTKQYAKKTDDGNVAVYSVENDWQSYTALTNSSVNMRMGTGYAYTVICRVPTGTEITVLVHVGDWYLVSYNNTIGFVNSVYITE